MHEWALAESIAATIAGEIEDKKLRRVLRVDVRIGELQQIDIDAFTFLLESLLETYELSLDISQIAISKEKSILKCRVCSAEWGFGKTEGKLGEDEGEAIHFIPEVAHIYIRCPKCGSPDFDILRGRGVRIKAIEGER